MRKLIQIILGLLIVGAIYVVVEQIMSPLRFAKEKSAREAVVVERLKDIRSAQRAFKGATQHYTASFDSLIAFVLNDSITVRKTIGSKDDSVAVAKGLVKEETYLVAAIDTVFGAKKLTPEMVKNLRFIPFTENQEFLIDAGTFITESKVVVPVFEVKAPYKTFLAGMDEQELINLIDERKTLNKYPGIKVGAMDQATNDAGNWE